MNDEGRIKGMAKAAGWWGGRVFLAVLVASLLATLAGTGLVWAQPPGNPANPLRTLPAALNPGQEFQVIVTFTAPADDFTIVGLEDSAPTGWTVRVNNGWCTPSAFASTPLVPWTSNKAEYLWDPLASYSAGTAFTAVYRVRVPGGAGQGTYSFAGLIRYYIGAAGPYEETIGGDMQVTVSGAPIPGITVGFTGYPVNKVAVAAPWIMSGAVVMFGMSLLAMKRRRAQS